MRFTTFVHEDKIYAGIVCSNGYYSFSDLFGKKRNSPKTVLEFIQKYEEKAMPDFEAIIAENGLQPFGADCVKLCSPIPMPLRNIICLGKNYEDHAKEVVQTKLETQNENYIPSAPVYFAKIANPATGDGDVIPLHSDFTRKVDYEVELAVIIGKETKCIEPENVESVIFGYTILNDVTARDVQSAYGQWYFGKSLDGFCPMGPHIVTKDEIEFPVKLNISCRVNEETRQSSNTELLIYDIPYIISELSKGITLYPGDIIATGTPGGIGHAMTPPEYLKSGDKIECEIENIGILTNTAE